ncbi:FHA domain-containing protein, partial [Gordonibacter urolithinfaciens]|uniref:FHA domain-containing protein n=1 Tax=Gordonibacter urolithinfaciens TaxID=1335613 RepID=UPI0012EDCD30
DIPAPAYAVDAYDDAAYPGFPGAVEQGYAPAAQPAPEYPAPNAAGYPNAAAAPAHPQPQPYQDLDAGFDEFGAQDAYGDFDPNGKPPLPYVPEDEIDYSIDYGEYTFDSQDFDDYRQNGRSQGAPVSGAAGAAMGAAAAGMAGAAASYAAQPGAAVPAGAPVAADTVVFAGGAAQASPVPNQAAVRASLIDTTNNRTYSLASARLLMGRESKNDIVVHDINASRTHAELRFEPQGVWTITDLGSTNGTLVNGAEIATHPLREGDRITIGMTNYVFTQAQ